MAHNFKKEFVFSTILNAEDIQTSLREFEFNHPTTKERLTGLVRMYMNYQNDRLRLEARQRKDVEFGREMAVNHAAIAFFQYMEDFIFAQLDRYTEIHPIAKWCKSNLGVGPVIAAGLMAHLNIRKEGVVTAGHFISYAGMSPDSKKEKGKKLPYNEELKKICYYLRESFMKLSSNPDALYGRLFAEKLWKERQINDTGGHVELAKTKLAQTNYSLSEDGGSELRHCHEAGKLSDGNLVARAGRSVIHIFLNHLFELWYAYEFGKPAPIPYVFAHKGHVHKIEPSMTIEEAIGLKKGEKVRDVRASSPTPLSDVTHLVGVEPHVSPNVIAFPGTKEAKAYYQEKKKLAGKSAEPK